MSIQRENTPPIEIASVPPTSSKIESSSPANVYYTNIQQGIIAITEDRLKLNAIEFDQSIKNSQNWHTPLGIFITILITLCSSEFHSIFNLSPKHVRDFFMCSFGASLLWLGYAVYKCQIAEKRISTPDELITACKTPPKKFGTDN